MAATDSPAGRAHATLVTAVVLAALAGCTSYAPAATAPLPTKPTLGASSPADSPSPCRCTSTSHRMRYRAKPPQSRAPSPQRQHHGGSASVVIGPSAQGMVGVGETFGDN